MEITNTEVEAAYDALHAAEVAQADNRFQLADRARALAYAYAVQEAKKHGLCVES